MIEDTGAAVTINNLPEEILVKIFLLYSTSSGSRELRFDAPLLFYQVCRHWHNIVLDTALLWTQIYFVDNVTQKKLAVYLERSKGARLQIVLYSPRANNTWLLLTLGTIRRHIGNPARIWSLRLWLHNLPTKPALQFAEALPALEELVMSDGFDFADPPPPEDPVGVVLPKIRYLCLTHFSRSIEWWHFRDIRELRLSTTSPQPAEILNATMRALTRLPGLVRLTIRLDWGVINSRWTRNAASERNEWEHDFPEYRMALPNLQFLCLRGLLDYHLKMFMASLEAPELRSLIILGGDAHFGIEPGRGAMTPWPSFPELRRFHSGWFTGSGDVFSHVVEGSCPGHLKELYLAGPQRKNERYIDAFVEGACRTPMRTLVTLKVKGLSPVAVRGIVQAHLSIWSVIFAKPSLGLEKGAAKSDFVARDEARSWLKENTTFTTFMPYRVPDATFYTWEDVREKKPLDLGGEEDDDARSSDGELWEEWREEEEEV